MAAVAGKDRSRRSAFRTSAGSTLRWVALGLAPLILLVGLWVAWSLVRPNPTGFAPTSGAAGAVADAPAGLQFTVDARSRREWVFFSFQSGAVVATTRATLDWDIAFRRNDILLNGGATNPLGKGGAVDLGEIALHEALIPPDGYQADVEDEERGLENPVMHGWYRYDWTTHVVSSKNHTYAVRSADGEHTVLLVILSYYCEDRSAACVTIRYVEGE